jgi:hypothetical protein
VFVSTSIAGSTSAAAATFSPEPASAARRAQSIVSNASALGGA